MLSVCESSSIPDHLTQQIYVHGKTTMRYTDTFMHGHW